MALASSLLWIAAQAASPADAARSAEADNKAAPDDSFLEFLGQDDVDDAKWWDFFRHTSAHKRDEGEDPPPGKDEEQ